MHNSETLLDLALSEKPHAEIIYVPHRDDVARLRKELEERSTLNRRYKVLFDPPAWPDLFSVVDHVYTVNAEQGLDALIHGCKVTVTGAPFYAGWGLTDDRLPLPRRGRQLTLDQLFCGVFLLYPRYLADLEDPVTGCLAAMLYIAGERKQKLFQQSKPERIAGEITASRYAEHWPLLLREDVLQHLAARNQLLQRLPDFYIQATGPLCKKSLAYFILGQTRHLVAAEAALSRIQSHLPLSSHAVILQDLLAMCPSEALQAQWAMCCEKSHNTSEARAILTALLAGNASKAERAPHLPIPAERWPIALQLAQLELKDRKLDAAERQFHHLLLSGNASGEVFSGLADISRLRFDFASAQALMAIFNHLAPGWKAGRGAILEAQMAAYAGDARKAAEAYAWACLINAEYADSNAFSLIADALEALVGSLPYGEAMHKAIEAAEKGSIIGRAKAFIAHDRPEAAEAMLLAYTPKPAEAQKYCLMLSQAYIYQGKLEQAKSLIENWLPHHPALAIYREGFQIAILKNDYHWGWALIEEATARNLDVGDANIRKMLLGLGRIRESYLSFRDMRASDLLKTYFGDRYVQDIAKLSTGKALSIVACFGPGDVIRFASLYEGFARQLEGQSLRFTCDPRLHALLTRSYPNLNFVPVARTRSLAGISHIENLHQLPGSDLHTFSDNRGWQVLQDSDRLSLTTDLLGDVIEGYESFSGAPYLVADNHKTINWSDRLRRLGSSPLIGLSWRSSLVTNFRNQHYLTVEELAPVFEIPGLRFVNLQYDECSEELAWIEQRFPGKMLHFPDLDQYNDLDGVAALMANLDLVIAPCTTVLELAGAIGRPAFLLSNSSELHWRKLPGTVNDVWHRSVEHVEGSSPGDKKSLVLNLEERLRDIAAAHSGRTEKRAC